jgi:hypothetical protein
MVKTTFKNSDILALYSALTTAAKTITASPEKYLKTGKFLDEKNAYFLAKNHSAFKKVAEVIGETNNTILAAFHTALTAAEIIDEKGQVIDNVQEKRRYANLRASYDAAHRESELYLNRESEIEVHFIRLADVQFSGEYFVALFSLFSE